MLKTKEDVQEEGYSLDESGTVTSPGKFEREPWWAVVIYGWAMDGVGEHIGEDEDDNAEWFELDPEEAAHFGIPGASGVIMEESSDGFVSVFASYECKPEPTSASEDNEPTEGDYLTADARGGISVSEHGGKYLGTFPNHETAYGFIRRRMMEEQFFPAVWFVSDHGNAHLIEDWTPETPLTRLRDERTGEIPHFAWPGGYPIAYIADDGGVFCGKCANGQDGSNASETADPGSGWRMVGYDVLEGSREDHGDVICDHCGADLLGED